MFSYDSLLQFGTLCFYVCDALFEVCLLNQITMPTKAEIIYIFCYCCSQLYPQYLAPNAYKYLIS